MPDSSLRHATIDHPGTFLHEERRDILEISGQLGVTFHNVKLVVVAAPPAGDVSASRAHWEDSLEVLYVIEGNISRIFFEPIDGGGRTTYEDLGKGTRVVIPARVAHLLEFSQASTVLLMNERPYRAEAHEPLQNWYDSQRERRRVSPA